METAAPFCPTCGEPASFTEDVFGRTVQRWTPTDHKPSLGDPRVGQVVAGRYRIVRRIGEGGVGRGGAGRSRIVRRMGEGGRGSVYAAWQRGAEQPVALKFINPQLVREPE